MKSGSNNNLKDILVFLIEIKCSRKEVDEIISKYPDIANYSVRELKDNYFMLRSIIDEKSLKKIICNNASVLTNNNPLDIVEINDIFLHYGLDLKEQIELLENNANIFSLSRRQLIMSLNCFWSLLGNNFKSFIMKNPIAIGITNMMYAKEYVVRNG